MNGHWIKATSLSILQQKRKTSVRHEGRQIALFLIGDRIFACNNRCPHEGYPLREGTVDGKCILTCNWHNWKFDLNNGSNLYGGDRLRTYPVEVRDDDIWVDLTDPPPAERRAEIMASLRNAFERNDYERLAREISRLRLTGADPMEAVKAAITWSHDRLEFGWTHAYAGAADWLKLYDEFDNDPETQLICVLEIVGHIADDVLRECVHAYPQAEAGYDDNTFVQAIDDEDETAAVAMLRGGLNAGLHFIDLEHALTRAALLHYNDFGHALIYVTKAGALIQRLGEEVELPLLLSLVRNLIFATREDQIPEFRGYAKALENWGHEPNEQAPVMGDYQGLGIDKALKLTVNHSTASAEALYSALLGANARNMLNYDMTFQQQVTGPVSDNVGWLDFTHGITFANAVHTQCRKFPEQWPAGLLQLACFSGRNNAFTLKGTNDGEWDVENADAFFQETVSGLFDHGKEEFIVSVHLVKTLLSAREELRSGINGETARAVLAAMNRFLHSPLKRKHVRRTARQAINFVEMDG